MPNPLSKDLQGAWGLKDRIMFELAKNHLDSLGIRAEALGLGRNPLYGATLLESEFGINQFNALLMQRNKIYDGFWKVRKK